MRRYIYVWSGGGTIPLLHRVRGTARPEIARNVTYLEQGQRGGDFSCDASLYTGAKKDTAGSDGRTGVLGEMPGCSREVFRFASVLSLSLSFLGFRYCNAADNIPFVGIESDNSRMSFYLKF